MVGPTEELLRALNASTTLEEAQEAFVATAARVIEAPAYAIYYLDPESGTPLRVRTHGASDSFLSQYEESGRTLDPILRRVRDDKRACSSSAFDGRTWRSHPFYPVVARGGFDSTLQAPIVVEGAFVGTLDFARRRGDRSFCEREVQLLDDVARHVSNTVARALRYEEIGRRSTVVERALDALGVAVVATSLDSRLLFGNRGATRLFGGAGRAPSLPLAVAEAIAADAQRLAAGRRTTTSEVPLQPSPLPLHPIQRRPGGGPPACRLTIRSVLVRECEAVVSLVYDRPRPLRHRIPVLSSREQEIVELVAHGLGTAQIAEAASITQNTVKQHLKRIFGKLDVHSRTELIAIAGTFAPDDEKEVRTTP